MTAAAKVVVAVFVVAFFYIAAEYPDDCLRGRLFYCDHVEGAMNYVAAKIGEMQ